MQEEEIGAHFATVAAAAPAPLRTVSARHAGMEMGRMLACVRRVNRGLRDGGGRAMIFVAADIGGSQARMLLAECDAAGACWTALRREVMASRDFADAEALLQHFLRAGARPQVACLALAGPLDGERVRLTNLPWTVDAIELAARLGLRSLRLINDFHAQALGLPELHARDLHTLQPGAPNATGVRALIGAGTGLGMVLLAEDRGELRVLPSEGGHADFAPRDAQQIALLQYLLPRTGRVALEDLLSGRGLERIYRFVAGLPDEPAPASPEAPAIGAAARAGERHASEAVDLFARLLASAAGNLALTALARGGVYLSGGIAPRILPFLRQPSVLAAFRDKPPMRDLLEAIPLSVVLDEQLGLIGAARAALQLVQESQ